jgi:hypothetical protein
MDRNNKTITNLGYANGWQQGGDNQKVISVCKNVGHVRSSFQVSKSIIEYQCDICGYKYRIDSGD